MPDISGKTYWLIGASAGLGSALAHALDAQGARLVLSARSRADLEALAKDLTDARAVPCDVTDAASVIAAAEDAGNIDGIIYCAGAYEPIEAQAWNTDQILKMADVNFQGAVRVLGAVLPDMIARDAGHIVLIGSLAGFRGLPGAQGYAASKSALMNMGESLFADLRKTGVHVQMACPGFIKTRLSDKNDFDMPQLMSPESAASHVVKAMKSNRFQTSFPSPFAWVFTLGRLIPARFFYRLFS